VPFTAAKAVGVPPPEKLVQRGVKLTQYQRQRDGTYLYGTYLWAEPTMGINRPGGSLGRSQACHLALRLWGDEAVTDAVLKEWLGPAVARQRRAGPGRQKPGPPASGL